MHYGVSFENFGELWREAMREHDGGYSARTLDDGAERQFWADFFCGRSDYAPDPYAEPLRRELRQLIGGVSPASILEIGPGWGNYTFELARLCRRMACVDISEDVLCFLTETAAARGVWLETVCTKWEDYNGEPFDVVFGFNCFYRMMDIERCLQKVNDMARRLCVIGMTSGPEQPYFREMEMALGLSINYHRLDYIHLLNVLYQLGMDCNVRIVPLERLYTFDSFDAAVRNAASRILDASYPEEAVREILSRYIKPDAAGRYSYLHHFSGAILYWEPQRHSG